MAEAWLRVRVDDVDDMDAARDVAEGMPDLDLKTASKAPSGAFEAQVEPVTAVLVGAAVATSVKFLLDWWDRRRGGLVIDQRPGSADDVHRDADVPYGYLVIYPPDGGTVNVETRDMPKDAMERLLANVLSGVMPTSSNWSDTSGRTRVHDPLGSSADA